MRRTTLYLGRTIDTVGRVSTDDLELFFQGVVAPLFPGFTVAHVLGYWEGISERTAVLTIIHNGTPSEAEGIDAIALAYVERFDQQAVLVETVETHAILETRSGAVSL